MPAEDSPSSVTTRVLTADVAHDRADAAAEALRELIGRFPQHPALIPIVDAGVADGQAFIVTPDVPGEPLDVALRIYGPAALADALPRLQQLADAIDVASRSGLCHGALTPAEIIVSAEETRCVGIGAATALAGAGISLPLQSPYAAPEVLDGGDLTTAADQYSLAVIAHEWLFGAPLNVDASATPPSLPDVDAKEFRRAFETATAAERQRRYPTCTAFVAAIAASVAVAETPRAKVIEFPPAPDELPLRVGAAEDVELGMPTMTQAVVQPAGQTFSVAAVIFALLGGVALGATAMWIHARGARGPVADDSIEVSRDAAGVKPSASADWDGERRSARSGPGSDSSEPRAGNSSAAREVTEAVIIPPREEPQEIPTPTVKSSASTDAAYASQPDAGLLVHSTPTGALVTVDGIARGTTPIAIRDLEIGTRRVVISRPGYGSVERQVVLTSERPSRALDVELPSIVARMTPVSSASPTSGILVIDSRPAGAQVFIDGDASGATPVTLTLPPGPHSVRIEHAGYRTVTSRVEVKAGERARVAARLEGGQDEQ